MDSQGKRDLAGSLRIMRDQVEASSWDAAIDAMEVALESTGRVDAARSVDGAITYDEPVDLAAYDEAIRKTVQPCPSGPRATPRRCAGRRATCTFSNDTIDWFLAEANAAQLRSVVGMIGHELEARERNRRARLYRRARFPQVKSFEGYDFSQVVLPEGIPWRIPSRCRSSIWRRTSCSMARLAGVRPIWSSRWATPRRWRERP